MDIAWGDLRWEGPRQHGFCTQNLVHTDAFTHRRFYTNRRLYGAQNFYIHRAAFTQRSLYTQDKGELFYTEAFT